MFDLINGIPVHPLVVHAIVVMLPLAVLGTIAIAVRPEWRLKYGHLVVALELASVVLLPVATSSGESLEERVGRSDLVHEHAEMGDVLPWVVLLATLVAAVLWWVWRRDRATTPEDGRTGASGLFRILAVVGVVAAVGLAVDVTLVGHSGAKAVWSDVGSKPAPAGGEGDD